MIKKNEWLLQLKIFKSSIDSKTSWVTTLQIATQYIQLISFFTPTQVTMFLGQVRRGHIKGHPPSPFIVRLPCRSLFSHVPGHISPPSQWHCRPFILHCWFFPAMEKGPGNANRFFFSSASFFPPNPLKTHNFFLLLAGNQINVILTKVTINKYACWRPANTGRCLVLFFYIWLITDSANVVKGF